jgi:hypothetical protein
MTLTPYHARHYSRFSRRHTQPVLNGAEGLSGLLFADPMEMSILNLLVCSDWLNCFACPVIDFIVLDVVLVNQDVRGWKIGKNKERAQKGNFSLYAMKTLLAMSVAFLLLCGFDSFMERNTTASGEYHEK